MERDEAILVVGGKDGSLQGYLDFSTVPPYCMQIGLYGLRGLFDELDIAYRDSFGIPPEFAEVIVACGDFEDRRPVNIHRLRHAADSHKDRMLDRIARSLRKALKEKAE